MAIKVKTFHDIEDEKLNEWIQKHVIKLLDIKFINDSFLVDYDTEVQTITTKIIYEGRKNV